MGGLRGSEDTIAAGTFDISPVEAAQTLKAADQPHRPYVRKRFVHRMALATLTPQCAAAWRHDMPPSTAFSTLLRISSLIMLVDAYVRGMRAFRAHFKAVVGRTP